MQHIIKCMDFLFLIKKANVSSGTLAFFWITCKTVWIKHRFS